MNQNEQTNGNWYDEDDYLEEEEEEEEEEEDVMNNEDVPTHFLNVLQNEFDESANKVQFEHRNKHIVLFHIKEGIRTILGRISWQLANTGTPQEIIEALQRSRTDDRLTYNALGHTLTVSGSMFEEAEIGQRKKQGKYSFAR